MARNFAHVFFLLYCLLMIRTYRRMLEVVLSRKCSPKELASKQKGAINRYFYLKLRPLLPPMLFYLNAVGVALFAFSAVNAVLIGWFSFAAVWMKIWVFLTVLCVMLTTSLLSVLKNIVRFRQPFFLYLPDPSPKTRLPFQSSLVDLGLYTLVPLTMLIGNFTL